MAKRRILIIDDQPVVRGALRNYFERRGYEVAEAASGDEALVQFNKMRSDALAVDCHLPDSSSHKLLGQIQSVLPDVPVIMVVSYASIAKAAQSMDGSTSPGVTDVDLPLAEIEKRHIQAVLRHSRGNIEKSAKVLGISRSSLYERVKRYEIQYPR